MSYGINPTFSTAPACKWCGSYNAMTHNENCLWQIMMQHSALVAELRNRIEILERKPMSAAMWCDPGHHAFSANDEGIETLTRTKVIHTDGYGGRKDVTVQIHICADHMKKFDPFGEHTDEEKIKKLEAWNDGWNAAKAGEAEVAGDGE